MCICSLHFVRWWKDLKVPTKFPFARDRIVECYFWTLGSYFEPHLSVGRKMLTKVIAISSILDDIYDAYGTFEELQVLTPAIQRLVQLILMNQDLNFKMLPHILIILWLKFFLKYLFNI